MQSKFVVKTFLLAGLLACISVPLSAQQYSERVDIHFPRGNSAWNPKFMNNGNELKGFIEKIRSYMNDSSYVVLGMDCYASASPEGTVALNEKIVRNRAKSVLDYLNRNIQLEDDHIRIYNVDEDWDYLKEQVGLLPVPYKVQVIDVIEATAADDAREHALKQVGGGNAWNYMMTNVFPKMRRVMLVVNVGVPEPEIFLLDTDLENPQVGVPVDDAPLHFNVEPLRVDKLDFTDVVPKHWYVKTNVAALGLLVANLALEKDLAKGFSLALPVYYSGVNYFSSRVKFRTLTFQPELRYWFNRSYYNFYCGVHAGLGWYNIATGKGWRIQDKDGSTPSIGGGFAAGYRTPRFGGRWHVEFSLGAGIYNAEYEKFHNEYNGQAYAAARKTYVGFDQVSISLVCKLNGKNRRSVK